MAFYNKQGRRVLLRKKSMAKSLGLTSTPMNTIVRKAVRKATKSAFAKKVMSVVKRNEETKYVAETITQVPGGPPTFLVPSFQVAPLNLSRMIPNLTQGPGEHQRIGDVVSPTRINCMWNLFLGNSGNAVDITLNIVIVSVKGANSQLALPGIPVGQFLKVGDGTNTDPNGFTPVQFLTEVNYYKVNSDQYTLHKWIKRRIVKGYGLQNVLPAPIPGASSPVADQGVVSIKYTWKPPKLKYNLAADITPTNHYPCYLIWATNNDGTALTGDTNFNCRSEMFFKDS